MNFLVSFLIIMAPCTYFPVVLDATTAVVFNIHSNHLNEPVPADATTTYDLHEAVYAHQMAISPRNNSSTSLLTTILLVITFLLHYQCSLPPEGVNNNCFHRDGITYATSTILQIHLNASSIFKNYLDSFLMTTVLPLQQLPDMYS